MRGVKKRYEDEEQRGWRGSVRGSESVTMRVSSFSRFHAKNSGVVSRLPPPAIDRLTEEPHRLFCLFLFGRGVTFTSEKDHVPEGIKFFKALSRFEHLTCAQSRFERRVCNPLSPFKKQRNRATLLSMLFVPDQIHYIDLYQRKRLTAFLAGLAMAAI